MFWQKFAFQKSVITGKAKSYSKMQVKIALVKCMIVNTEVCKRMFFYCINATYCGFTFYLQVECDIADISLVIFITYFCC